MDKHPEPTTNIGQLVGKILEYEQAIQSVITTLDDLKTLSVGGTVQPPPLKGIHVHGGVYDWDLGKITKRS